MISESATLLLLPPPLLLLIKSLSVLPSEGRRGLDLECS
jgi:hypothetical protein